MMTRRTESQFVRCLWITLLLATVFNGTGFWLKRVGVMTPELAAEFRCKDPGISDRLLTGRQKEELNAIADRLYELSPTEKVFKSAKYAWMMAACLIAVGLYRRQGRSFSRAGRRLILCLILFLMVSFGSVSLRYNGMLALAGLKSLLFLPFVLFGGGLLNRERLDFLANTLLALVFIQVPLVLFEILWGIRIFRAELLGVRLWDRVVGTMVMPASLGVFAVLALGFYRRYSKHARFQTPLAMATTLLVFLSASGTAWLMLAAFFAMEMSILFRWRQKRRAFIPVALLFLLIVVLLPGLSGRFDIYDSLWGRLMHAERILTQEDALPLLVGKGPGFGTNGRIQMVRHARFEWNLGDIRRYTDPDSTPVSLLQQFGLVGVILFYGTFFRAGIVATDAAPLLALIGIGSLTLNLLEFFPVNVLLALILADAFGAPSCLPAKERTILKNSRNRGFYR